MKIRNNLLFIVLLFVLMMHVFSCSDDDGEGTATYIFVTEYDGWRISCWSYQGTNPAGAVYLGALDTGGASPTALIKHPTLPYIYVFHKNSTEISLFKINNSKKAGIDFVSASSLRRADYSAISADGRFLFLASWGNRTISTYAINSATGALTEIPGSPIEISATGKIKDLALAPDGKFLLASNSDNSSIHTLAIETNGSLIPSGLETVDSSNTAAGIEFHPDGKGLYAGFTGSAQICYLTYNSATGAVSNTGSKMSLASFGTNPGDFKITADGKTLVCFETGASLHVTSFSINTNTWGLTRRNSMYGMGSIFHGIVLDPTSSSAAVTTLDNNSVVFYGITADGGLRLQGDINIGSATSPTGVIFVK